MQQETITFYSGNLKLEGVLRYPDQLKKPVPCLLLIHGSMEHDRDGNILKTQDNRHVHKKNFFLEISVRLCAAGFATFSWDKRGFGKSEGSTCEYSEQAQDAKAALDVLTQRKDVVNSNAIAVFGQSAGVYVSCLLAKEENRPNAYVLSGGLYRDYNEMMSYNYHRVRDYANRSPAHLEWVEKNDLWGLALGVNLDRMFEAISMGETEFRVEYKGHVWMFPLNNQIHTPEYASKNQFKYIKRPTLIIHGDTDLNVPVQDAESIEKELKRIGNNDVKRVIIKNADHSFQEVDPDEETRLKERMSLESFKHPYIESYFQNIIAFLKERFPDA
jgi:dipeptidyl aminopeptidase/acylaminoacyl peptidase